MGIKQWLTILVFCLPGIVTYAELINTKKIKYMVAGIFLSLIECVLLFFGFETIANVIISLFIIGVFSRIILQTVMVHKMNLFNAACAVIMIIFIELYPKIMTFVENNLAWQDSEKVVYKFLTLAFVFMVPIINVGLINMTRDVAIKVDSENKEEKEEKKEEEEETNQENKPKHKHKTHSKKKKKSKKKK